MDRYATVETLDRPATVETENQRRDAETSFPKRVRDRLHDEPQMGLQSITAKPPPWTAEVRS